MFIDFSQPKMEALYCNLYPVEQSQKDQDGSVQINSRTIGDLLVKCSFHTTGCKWSSELRDLEGHKDRCQFAPIRGVTGLSVFS